MKLPASDHINLSDWNLTLPVDASGNTSGIAYTVKTPLADFTNAQYFHLGTDGALVFRAQVDGATTTGTHYARSELRELTGEKLAAWHLNEGGTMTASLRVDEAPLYKDGTVGKMVIGQIHGAHDELVRLYWDNGTVYFKNDQSGADNKEHRFDLVDHTGAIATIALHENFSYKIDAHGDKLTVEVNTAGNVYTSTTSINSIWQSDTLYFKAGVYLGVNETQGTGAGEVAFTRIDYSHVQGAGLDGLANEALVLHQGTAGNDTIHGDTHADKLVGNDGNDTLNGHSGNDILFGGNGNDSLSGTSGNDLLHGDAGDDSLYGGSGNDLAAGDAGNDLLRGGSGNDVLYGGDGNDFIYGGSDDDLLHGDAGNDTLYGGSGTDLLTGDAGNDWLYGNAGDDTIQGGAGSDVLYGSSGDDALAGGVGNDLLYGGSGNDTFIFTSINEAGDTVMDFRHGDQIDISGVVNEMIPAAGHLSFSELVAGKFLELHYNAADHVTNVSVDLDGIKNGAHSVQLVGIHGSGVLTADNFTI